MPSELHVVTGAFGYSGRYIARRLLDTGQRVRTLTSAPHRANPFGAQVEVHPFNFDQPARLAESLRGAAVLYNTYWIRFNHAKFKQADAVRNTLILFEAARQAGVRRIVHVSITNPSEDSPLEYFRGKARLERALAETGIPHTILRPAVLFGGEDILINNIAWMLRRFPVFGVFGTGQYRLQPIHVEDLAALAVQEGNHYVYDRASDEQSRDEQSRDREGAETTAELPQPLPYGRGSDRPSHSTSQAHRPTAHPDANRLIDAIGPETFTYRELAQQIGEIIGHPRPIISVPPLIGYAIGAVVGQWVGDVVVTRAEIEGLMADLLYTNSPPAGQTKLTDWARAHAATLGRHYASELARRTDRTSAYEKL